MKYAVYKFFMFFANLFSAIASALRAIAYAVR